MGLTLRKYEPLPDLTVQGNNYQAPNLSITPNVAPAQNISIAPNVQPSQNIGVPTFRGPGTYSWSQAPLSHPSPPNHFMSFAQNQIQPLENSVLGSGIKIAAADLTNNQLARTNASQAFKQASDKLGQRARDPQTAFALTGEGGVDKPKVTLSSQELAAGRALGMSNKDVVAAKTDNALPKAVSTAASKMSPEELANLKPGEQMAVARVQGAGPPSQGEIAAGLKANPYKSNVVPTNAGDYTGARLAGGAVADPIRVAGRIADYHLGQVGKDNPALYKDVWSAIEKGTVPKDAPASFQDFSKWFREVANGGHKESNMLGTPTRYKQNWEIRAASLKDVNPEQIATGQMGSLAKHTIQRKYNTHAEFVAAAEKAGMAVEKDPRVALRKYVAATTSTLERKSIAKALTEADAGNQVKPHTLDLGWGTTVPLSDKGLAQAKGVMLMSPSGKTMSLYDAANSMAKGSLLSISQFHPVNISVLRAGTSLMMPKLGDLLHGDLTAGVHPARAARGVYGTFRPLAPGGEKYVTKNLADAYQRGDIAFASRHGLPFGQTSYGELGGKFNVGHKMVFEKQLPMMHKEIVGAMRDAMKTYGLAEGSPKAMELGKVMNATMGFMNREAMNVSPGVVKGVQRTMLAGQFTPSKFVNMKKAVSSMGAAGAYARADVTANAAGAVALIGGIGYLMHQKSDDIRDIALRALINPAAPTNTKDAKGNTQEIRIPLTYTSEIAHILGIKLVRQPDGHLGIDFHANNIPGTAGEWAKARLSPIASAGVKLKTNTNFSDKPLYDPNAPAGTKTEQTATTLLQGVLPIGAQGLPYVKAVNKHLPGNVQDVLNAGAPSSNPILKSSLSSIGLTPRTDQTVGKAKDTAAYFNAVDANAKGLDRQSKDAYDLWTGSKKNPVTGKYDVQPSYNDARTKAAALLQNPKALNAIINLNQGLAKQGQASDPLWGLPKDQITSYLQYQNMAPGGADKSNWFAQNKTWYSPLIDARNKFFADLPPGDPNKPKLDLQYPEASKQVSDLMDQYSNISDSKQKGAFLDAHPELISQWNAQAKYTNDLRQKLGYSPLKGYPEPTTQLQSFMDTYNGASKSQRKAIRNGDPKSYQEMIGYFDSVDLYNVGKGASQAQFRGNSDYTSKEAKAISSLAQDVYQNPDGTYSVVPAGWMNGLSNSGSSSSSGSSSGSRGSRSSSSRSRTEYGPNGKYYGKNFSLSRTTLDLATGKKVSTPTLSAPKAKAKVAKKKGSAKPKVAFKRLRV